MFHRKRHHHHQHSRPAVANRQPEGNDTNLDGLKRHSEPASVGVDIEPTESSSSHSSKTGQQDSADLGAELSAFRRRCTSPVCATAVEMATGMVEGFRLPDHSPSPVRKQLGTCVPGRSLSAVSPENNNTHTSLTSSPSSLTGLFRRKRSPMDFSSQSFHSKSPSSCGTIQKPSAPLKPQRLDAHGTSGGSCGTMEPKGRSLSPMPSGNLLAAMVMNSIHSAVLDVGQSASERQSRRANSASHQNREHQQQHQQQPLPHLVINAKSTECLAIGSEPTSPLADPRQFLTLFLFFSHFYPPQKALT